MSLNKQRPPEPWKQLYESVFGQVDNHSVTLGIISQGLTGVIDNAERLISDVRLLLDEKRYASATFLLATTDEEMAKSYILLDMCRLDFERDEGVLKALCKAFYNHVMKYAYNQVVRFSHFRDMNQVKEVWESAVKRWWPSSGPESGEPDMPHDTYFLRESQLYVDYGEDQWLLPQNNPLLFDIDDLGKYLCKDPLSVSEPALNRLKVTADAGLFTAKCLSIINEVSKQHRMTEKTTLEEIFRLWAETISKIEKELGIEKERFFESALMEVPLYHFFQH